MSNTYILKFNNGRRGEEESINYVVVGAIFLVIMIALLYFFTNLNYGSSADEEKCLASVKAVSTLPGSSLDDLKCETSYDSVDTKDEEYVKSKIANDMISCWYKFGSGELNLPGGEPRLVGNDSVRFCNVCNVYYFKSKIENNKNNNIITDFGTYLAEKDVPQFYEKVTSSKTIKDDPKERSTYLEYLKGRKMDNGALESFSKEVDTVIDTSKDYSVIFVYTKDPSILSRRYIFDKALKSNVLGLYFYGSLGMFFGRGNADGWQSGVVLVPYSEQEVKGLCENIV